MTATNTPPGGQTPHKDSAQTDEKAGTCRPDNSISCSATTPRTQGETWTLDPACGENEARNDRKPHNSPHNEPDGSHPLQRLAGALDDAKDGRVKDAAATLASIQADALDRARGELADLLDGRGPELLDALEAQQGLGTATGRLRKAAELAQSARPVRQGDRDLLTVEIGGGPEVVVPDRWKLDRSGALSLWRDDVLEPVTPHAPLILARLSHAETGEVYETVTFRSGGQWAQLTVPTSDLRDARRIVKLSDRGLDVTSNTASRLVEWLHDFRAVNEGWIPATLGGDRFGWYDLGGDEVAFLLGEASRGGALRYLPTDGRRQYGRGLRKSESLDVWRTRVWEPIADHPRLSLAVYAALAPALLRVVKAQGFLVEWAGETGTGKTTALRVAASVWGDPSEDGGVLHGWNAGIGGLRMLAGVFHDVPLLLDETQQSDALTRNQGARLSGFVYEVVNGKGRNRGTADAGAHDTANYRTVVLSTGEQPIVDVSQDAGLRARCLVLWGSPIAADGVDGGRVANALNDATADAFGSVAPLVVGYLADDPGRWRALTERWRELRTEYEGKIKANKHAARFAQHVATLHLAAEVARDAAGLDVRDNALAEAVAAADRMAGEVDRPLAALRHVAGWVAQRQSDLVNSEGWKAGLPGRIIGLQYNQPGEGWKAPELLVNACNEALRDGGFAPKAIRGLWLERGWINPEDNGTPRVTVHGQRSRVVRFTEKGWKLV